MITGVIAIILVLGGLIFFHELGHFAVARLLGMGVKTFSLGFGPKLAGVTSGNTEYKLSAIPLGGYVALAGEQGEEEVGFPDDQLFSHRPAWQRLCVVAAGPIFNLLLAFLIFWGIILIQGQATVLPTVGGVISDTPAAKAGIKVHDRITALDGKPIDSWPDLVTAVRSTGEQELELNIERDGETVILRMTPQVQTFQDLYGEDVTVPIIGIQPGNEVRYDPVEGIGITEALQHTWLQTVGVIKGFKNIIMRLIPVEMVGGPIMLAQIIHDSAQTGILDLLFKAAIISINLAIINLLPIPVLDGGHILFFTLEMIFRRPLSEKWKARAMRVGILILLSLMSLAIFNDFKRLLS